MEIDTEYVEVKRNIFPKCLMSDLNISFYNLPQKKESPPKIPKWKPEENVENVKNVENVENT